MNDDPVIDNVRCPRDGKCCYGCRADARTALRNILQSHRRRGTQREDNLLHVYECPHCSMWHVGHVRRGTDR